MGTLIHIFTIILTTRLGLTVDYYRDSVREASLTDEGVVYHILDSAEDGTEDDKFANLGPCPANYTDGNDGNCYKIYTNHSNYYDASEKCKSDGGMLVSIHNEQKNNLIKQMAEQAGSLVWLALKCTQIYWSRVCKWDDDQPSGYTKFFEGNPSQIGKCVVMMIGEVTKGKWVSADCEYMRVGFVCQIARKELCGDYQEYAEGRRCYKKIDQRLSHDDAEQYCQNECGHLASIHSEKESDIVHGLFGKGDNYARIGLKYSNGNYSWVDNTTFDYNKFGYNNTALGECAAMSLRDEVIRAKGWINVDCDLALPFVCQRERGACFNSTNTPDQPVVPSPPNCNEPQYLEQNGTIYSPQYPSYYRKSKACYYVMVASPGSVVQLHFDDLQLNAGDTIHIYNALTDSIPSERIASVVPSTKYFHSTTNVMKLVFVPGNHPNHFGNVDHRSRWRAVFVTRRKS